MKKLLPHLKKHQKIYKCLPEHIIKKISRHTKIPIHKIYHKVCYQHEVPGEKEDYNAVLQLLRENKKHIVVQTAPSIRVSIAEEFGFPAGTITLGKMIAAARKCGFRKIFDTNLGADMTIVEEATELVNRLKAKKNLPLITTCCPAWVRFMEYFHHEIIPDMSTCKSPNAMLGTLIKEYYSRLHSIPKKDIVVVSIMPCTVKRFECRRPELKHYVDYVITTAEFADMIKHFNIDFKNLPDEDFDPALGLSTGAGAIFGATGGVMEAALRTAYEFETGRQLQNLEFRQVRGTKGIREAVITLNGKKIKCAVANGLENANVLLKNIKKYDFIEIMACHGGCVGGDGQPQPAVKSKIKKRISAIFQHDKTLPYRKAHENPLVKKIYMEFIGKPLGKKAEKFLHTHYTERRF